MDKKMSKTDFPKDGLKIRSKYWQNALGKEVAQYQDLQEGKVYDRYNDLGCDECCNGDRCDDPTHRLRSECTYCLGTGQNKSCFNDPTLYSNNNQIK